MSQTQQTRSFGPYTLVYRLPSSLAEKDRQDVPENTAAMSILKDELDFIIEDEVNPFGMYRDIDTVDEAMCLRILNEIEQAGANLDSALTVRASDDTIDELDLRHVDAIDMLYQYLRI